MTEPTTARVENWRELLIATERVLTLIREAVAEHGLSVSEFDVLANLKPGESCRHAELTSRVILTRTAMTRLVDRLVHDGLLVRTADEQDRRSVLIALTEEGERVRRGAMVANARAVRTAFQDLTDQEMTMLSHVTPRIAP